jgi:hypothetical protein
MLPSNKVPLYLQTSSTYAIARYRPYSNLPPSKQPWIIKDCVHQRLRSVLIISTNQRTLFMYIKSRPMSKPIDIISYLIYFFFFLSFVTGAALVPKIASKVLLGSVLEDGRSWGELADGGATPGGRGSASRPRFMTLSRRRSGLFGRERSAPAVEGSSSPGGGGSGAALTLSSCIAALRNVSLAAHCCALFQQCERRKMPSTPCSTMSVGRLTTCAPPPTPNHVRARAVSSRPHGTPLRGT